MAHDAIEMLDTPEPCEETTEYDNRIEEEVEVELEEEEQEDFDTQHNLEEVEQQFARFERNYRARRIRELTLAPIKKKRGRIGRTVTEAAA